jgi:hypothetical protein
MKMGGYPAYKYTENNNINLDDYQGEDNYQGYTKKVYFRNGDDMMEANFNESYRFENFEFSTMAGWPFHAVMWVDNFHKENQDHPFEIKVESHWESPQPGVAPERNSHRAADHNVEVFKGGLGYKISGRYFVLKYKAFQVTYGGEDTYSVCDAYYIVYSTNKWNSFFAGEFDTEFDSGMEDWSSRATVPQDTEFTFLGYSLMSKYGKYKNKDMRSILRPVLKSFSDVDNSSSSTKKREVNNNAGDVWSWW